MGPENGKPQDDKPFAQREVGDQPGLIGARWWQDQLSQADNPQARRNALKTLLLMGGSVVGAGALISAISSRSSSDERTELRDALSLQREHGWSFGADGERVAFPSASGPGPGAAVLSALSVDLSPRQSALKPYYRPTLLQSVAGGAAGSPAAAAQAALQAQAVPIDTPAMDLACQRGAALADLLRGTPLLAVIVDLPGPESVAFAAGMAELFEPVFSFDNWPHPRGVVPAHLTLGALLHHRARLLQAAQQRGPSAPAAFVLDRSRLSPYRDEKEQFDNRYLAVIPSAQQWVTLEVKTLLYVAPDASSLESDDLNEEFVDARRAGLNVKLVAATDFRPDPALPATPPRLWYGGSPAAHRGFWLLHSWGPNAPPTGVALPTGVSNGWQYEPAPRPTLFTGPDLAAPSPSSTLSAAAPPAHLRPRPRGFATFPVLVHIHTGAVMGPAFGRGSTSRSSWFRFSSTGG